MASDNVNVLSYSSRGHNYKMGFAGAKVKALAGRAEFLLETRGRSACSYLLHLLEATCVPRFVGPFSMFKSGSIVSSNLTLPPFTCKDPCDSIEHIQIIQDNLLISISLT